MSFAGVFVMDMLGFVRGQLMMMEIVSAQQNRTGLFSK